MSTPQDPINPYAPSSTSELESFSPVAAFGSEKALKRVADGLNLVYWGIAITLLSIIGGMVLIFAFGAMGGDLAAIPAVLMGLGIIAGVIIGLVGRIFCLDVPEETNARPMIYSAVVCDILAVLVSVVVWIPGIPQAISSVNNLLSLLATLLFVIFMKRIANFIQRPELADRAQSLVTFAVVLIVLAFGAAFLAMLVGPIAMLLGLVAFVLAIVMFLRYVRLLIDLRRAILGPVG
jgi:hypothetical protein